MVREMLHVSDDLLFYFVLFKIKKYCDLGKSLQI